MSLESLDISVAQVLMAMAFLLGCNIATVLVHFRSSRAEDPRNSKIRNLEAETRMRDKRIEELEQELQQSQSELEETTAKLSELEETQEKGVEDITYLKSELKESIAKTDQLRNELSDRAIEDVKNHLRSEEMRTELQVTQAGADAVFAEVGRLEAERDHLTSTVTCLKEKLAESLSSPDMIDAQLAQMQAEQPNPQSDHVETMVAPDIPPNAEAQVQALFDGGAAELPEAPTQSRKPEYLGVETVAEEAATDNSALGSDLLDVEEFLGTDVADPATEK